MELEFLKSEVAMTGWVAAGDVAYSALPFRVDYLVIYFEVSNLLA
jgi:hypothetical protein